MMKRILILLAIALILAGGAGAAAYFFVPELLGIKKEEAVAEAKEPEPEPKPDLVKPILQHVKTLDIPLVIDNKVDRHIYFDVTLIVDPEHYAEVELLLPRIESAYIQFAYAAFPKQYKEHGKMDLPKLRVSLKKIAQKTLGEDLIHDALLQSYFER